MNNKAFTDADTVILPRCDLYQVTDIIVELLKAGTMPWCLPQKGYEVFTIPKNFSTGKIYRGTNTVLLWTYALDNQFSTHVWATSKEWNERGEAIRTGEKGSLIFCDDFLSNKIDNKTISTPFLSAILYLTRRN